MAQNTINKAYSYIRISSKRQVDGYGIARQTEKAQKYATENGLELDTELQDVGSGYHGKHVKFGALGGFLRLVEQGKVPVGSTLIVESLDRLSREDVLIAQAQFIDVLLAGITIVTLIDKQVYHRDRDFTQLIMSLSIMKRANDESVTKQERSKDNVRRNKMEALAGHKRFNISCVRWIDQIRISRHEYDFSLNKHAITVRRMYEMYDGGLGVHTIARTFNQEAIPVFKDGSSKSKVWKDAAIRRILRDETANGTYHVWENVDGKRVSLGEPIRCYYPAAVDEELFWRVQRRHDQIAIPGRTGRKFSNLFANTTKCSKCGRPVRLVQSGGAKSGEGRSLLFMCKGRFETGLDNCVTKPKSFPYNALEQSILDHIDEFSLDLEFAGGRNVPSEAIRGVIAEIEQSIADIEKRRFALVDTIEFTEEREERLELLARATAMRLELEKLKAKVGEHRQQLRQIEEDSVEVTTIAQMIKSERATWSSGSDDEVRESRAKVSLALRKFISRITIFFGEKYAEVAIAGILKRYQFDREGNVIHIFDLTPYLQKGPVRHWIEHSPVGRPIKIHQYASKPVTWDEIERSMLADSYADEQIQAARENFKRLSFQPQPSASNPRLNDPEVLKMKAERQARATEWEAERDAKLAGK